MLTKEQKIARSHTLGASEIPAIMGFDVFKGPWKVWYDKIYPEAEEEEESPQQSRGIFAEPMIAAMYQRDTGREAYLCQRQIVHPKFDWLTCTPDYLTSPGQLRNIDRGLECKSTAFLLDARYCLPAHEYQARAQLSCQPGLLAVDVAAIDPWAWADGKPYYYEILPDPQKERLLLAAAQEFWFKHVVARVEPDPDQTKAYARWRDAMPSQGLELELPDRPEDPELRELLNSILRYRDISETINHLNLTKSLALNVMRLKLEKYDVVRGSFGSFHYKTYADSRSVMWENVARHLGAAHQVSEDDFNQLVLIHTKINPGGRHPMPRWKKNPQGGTKNGQAQSSPAAALHDRRDAGLPGEPAGGSVGEGEPTPGVDVRQ